MLFKLFAWPTTRQGACRAFVLPSRVCHASYESFASDASGSHKHNIATRVDCFKSVWAAMLLALVLISGMVCKLTFFCAMIYDLPFCIELYSGYQAMTTCWPKSKHLDTHNKKPLQPVKYSIALQASFCLFLAVGIGHIEWTCGRALYMYQFLLYSQFQYVS